MYEFKPDKINIIILDKGLSTSGKYEFFLGEHYNGVDRCYDVGVFNMFSGELIRRHYQLKWEAEEFYEEWKEKMREEKEYEEDEPSGFNIIKPC